MWLNMLYVYDEMWFFWMWMWNCIQIQGFAGFERYALYLCFVSSVFGGSHGFLKGAYWYIKY